MTQDQKLSRFAHRELLRNIDHMVLQDDDGTVVAFGQYLIERATQGFTVRTLSDNCYEFTDQRTAMSWCTLDRLQYYQDASQIMSLELKRQLLAADIACMRGSIRRVRNGDLLDTLMAKIAPKVEQHRVIMNELEKLANRAKYLQIKGFSNETARTIGALAK